MSTSKPSLGIVDWSVNVANGNLTCAFLRENFNTDSGNYLQVQPSSQFYVLTAYGSGNVSFHGSNRDVSATLQSFASNYTVPGTTTPATPAAAIKNKIVEFFKKALSWLLSLFNL
jgi:hypothetical protein